MADMVGLTSFIERTGSRGLILTPCCTVPVTPCGAALGLRDYQELAFRHSGLAYVTFFAEIIPPEGCW